MQTEAQFLAQARLRFRAVEGVDFEVISPLTEYNHYHDARGRFSSGAAGGGILDNASITSKVASGLDENGGVSVTANGTYPTDGFMVAYDAKDGHGDVIDATNKAARDAAIRDWVKSQRRFVASDPNHHFGGWVDNGKAYLDVSQRFAPNQKGAAIGAGKARNQIAIFDLGTMDEIQTGGTGK